MHACFSHSHTSYTPLRTSSCNDDQQRQSEPQRMEDRFPNVSGEVWALMRRFHLDDQAMGEIAHTGLRRMDQIQVSRTSRQLLVYIKIGQ